MVAVVALTTVSCNQGENNNRSVVNVKIKPTDWERVPEDMNLPFVCYKATVDMPEIGLYQYELAMVNVYNEYQIGEKDNKKIYAQAPLPYTIHNLDEEGKEWSENLSYDFTMGDVTFYIEYSDFKERRIADTYYYRVILTW